MPLMEALLNERELYLVMLKCIEDKRTLTTLNIYDALEISSMQASNNYEKKESTKTTHTDSHAGG